MNSHLSARSARRKVSGFVWRAVVVAMTALRLPFVTAGPGDIRITVVDPAGQPVAGVRGGRAGMVGLSSSETTMLLERDADAQGLVTFMRAEIVEWLPGDFGFIVTAVIHPEGLRAQIYDPFGWRGTYLRYDPKIEHAFTIPAPAAGSVTPEILWKGTESEIRFPVDLGDWARTEPWILRILLQTAATGAVLSDHGLAIDPILSGPWLAKRACVLDDHGLQSGQTGAVVLSNAVSSRPFLATKRAGGMGGPSYEIHLVNVTGDQPLPATYVSGARVCRATFDPLHVFTDTKVPGWAGQQLKPGVEYFPHLQLVWWVWNSLGTSNGLALAWGPPAAEGLFHPMNLPTTPPRITTLGRSGRDFLIYISGSAALPFRVQYSGTLAPQSPWFDLVLTNSSVSGFVVQDSAQAVQRFYRLIQP